MGSMVVAQYMSMSVNLVGSRSTTSIRPPPLGRTGMPCLSRTPQMVRLQAVLINDLASIFNDLDQWRDREAALNCIGKNG